MAFWGAMVPKDQPYTLQLDGDRKRVRITQATVGDYSGWPYAWSKLKCAVGSKPPMYICSLSKALPFCQLDLEFEESEEVVFSIKGPQGIHLSGYYVSPSAAAKKEITSNGADDLAIDCHSEEDIVMAEKEEGKKLTAEEDIGHTHRLANCGQHNNCDDDHNLMIGNVNDNDQLVNAETNEDDDEKTAKEQEEIIYAFDSELPEEEDDDYVLCIRKSARTAKKMVEKVEEDADKVTVEPNRMLKDSGRVDSISKETTDATSREQENERRQDQEIFDKDDTNSHEDAIDEVKEQTANTENDAFHRDCARNQHVKTSAINVITFNDASEMLDHNLDRAQNMVNVSHIKVEEQTPSSDKVIGNPYSGEGHCRNENLVIVLPENAEDHKPIDYIAEEEQVQKKKQKTIAKENEKNNCVNPCKLRTLSNGMIIEDLEMGKSNGKKAAQGRKVKIFYSARLRNTGLLVETNVGEKPLKFCVGEERIIKGFNIGIDGMHIGGRRRLIIPPAFGYGGKVKAQLPPDSWLVSDIELVGVKIDKRK